MPKHFLALILVGLGLLFFGVWKSRSFSDTQIYSYEIESTGGMANGLNIYSSWKGKLAVSLSAKSIMVRPLETAANLIVNQESKQSVVLSLLADYEKTFAIELSANQFIRSIKVEKSSNPNLSILYNQIRMLSNYLALPQLLPGSYEGPCYLGKCVFVYSVEGDHFSISRSNSGVPAKTNYQASWDNKGLLWMEGSEDLENNQTGITNHTKIKFKREGVSKEKLNFELSQGNFEILNPAMSGMSDAEKRAVIAEQLKGITYGDLLARAKKISNAQDKSWGSIYTDLKNLLILDPSLVDRLKLDLINRSLKDHFFSLGINALKSSGTKESQSALIDIFIGLGDQKSRESVLVALGTIENPNRETADFLLELANWRANTPSSDAHLARLLSGSLAQKFSSDQEYSHKLIEGAINQLYQPRASQEEIMESLTSLGNSGAAEVGPIAKEFLQKSKDPHIRQRAIDALRFVPNEEDFLWSLAKGNDVDAKAAKYSLKIRCQFLVCKEQVKVWLTNSNH